MRIIGGKWGGRKIQPPHHMPHTRPTTDIAKEGLFNILQNLLDFEGLQVLDLFGGTGAITYEMLSRGAAHSTVVEKDPKMYAFISSNLQKLGGADAATLLRLDVLAFLQTTPQRFDFIFAGPPYAMAEIDMLPQLVVERKLLNDDGIFVLEHTPRNNYQDFAGYFRERNYGTTVFSFFT